VTLSTADTSTQLKRENLGQIQSQGVELVAQVQPFHSLSANFGYEYAHAVVTNFAAQPALVGLWIPEVPRHAATAQLRYHPGGPIFFTLAARETGHAFDDSSNLYKLHGFFVLDAYAEGHLNEHLSAYVSFQNLLNREIETARTPYLTLGTPFTTQGGLRLNFGTHPAAP
jgi:outer membrane receptor protein involved in Fe transport